MGSLWSLSRSVTSGVAFYIATKTSAEGRNVIPILSSVRLFRSSIVIAVHVLRVTISLGHFKSFDTI